MYIEMPNVPGTAESRIAALKESRQLLKGEAKVSGPAIFGGGATEPGPVAGSTELIDLATYIETGHAYVDLHPVGKRRPIVHHQHVTVLAPGGVPDQEDIEHLLSHVADGSFEEFMQDLLKQAAKQHEGAGEPTEGDGDAPEKDGSE
jgi:hypothetical protein